MFALRFIAHSKARFKPDNTWVDRKPKINLKIMPGPQQTILSFQQNAFFALFFFHFYCLFQQLFVWIRLRKDFYRIFLFKNYLHL